MNIALIPAPPDEDAVKAAEQLAVPVDPATRPQGDPVIDPVTFSLNDTVPPGV